MSTDIREVRAGLRAWAKGVYPLEAAELVLAAIAHAGGTPEHTGAPMPDPHGRYRAGDGTRMSFLRLGSLHPWPEAQ